MSDRLVHLHLVSMPFAHVLSPSLQLGTLKAYVDRFFSGSKKFRSSAYSGYFDVFHNAGIEIPKMIGTYTGLVWHCENFYYLLFLRQFYSEYGWDSKKIPFDRLIDRMNTLKCSSKGKTEQKTVLTKEVLENWNNATINFLNDRLLPSLSTDAVNIIGLSVQFWQIFSSFYCVKYLERHRKKYPMVFVYGGACTSDPSFHMLAGRYQIPGLAVIGEGENQLTKIISLALNSEATDPLPPDKIARELPNAVILDPSKGCSGEPPRMPDIPSDIQVENLDDLPFPDYEDFFRSLGQADVKPGLLRYLLEYSCYCPLEASRGCSYGRCKFCNYNRMWVGFRKKSRARIQAELARIYKTSSMGLAIFTDNLANDWISDLCRDIIDKNLVIPSGAEVRATRNERQWIEMALAGVKIAFVGTESLSDKLLRKMQKGNTVMNNLCSHKYAVELEIQFFSNLILNHPASTLEDVHETIRILTAIPHFNPYLYNRYILCTGSADFAEIDAGAGARLMEDAVSFYLMKFDADIPMQSLTINMPHPDPQVAAAWDQFERWYENVSEVLRRKKPKLRIESHAEGAVRIVDSRGGDFKTIWLKPPHSLVLDCCHAPQNLSEIAGKLNLTTEEASRVAGELLEMKLLLCVGKDYLTIALRSRDSLINNYHRKYNANR